MHYFTTIRRVIIAGFRNFLRNAWLSTAATAIMLVTLLIMLTGVIMNLALSKEIDNITRDIGVNIYFLDEDKPELRSQLKSELKQLKNVRSISYISKAQALEDFNKQNENQPEILDGLSIAKNALPASFEVKVYDLNDINPIAKIAEKDEYKELVEETSYDNDTEERIDTIGKTQRFVTRGLIVAGIVFAGISILIIFNTIRMAIFTRSEEIKIMKLIGATNSYVRGPFLFESVLYGLIAASFALILIYALMATLGNDMNRYIDFSTVMATFRGQWYLVVIGTYIAGIGLGLASSTLAMAKYLKLQ